MYQSYGIGYEEYNRKLENRLEVEKEREKDHRKSMQILSQYSRQIHT
ncbi:hypothetical protein [Evansella clarkii]|nr:hypothetical protein [Evansella clarkii]